MVHVVLMCGPAGSGKTTAARRLEAQGYVRLSLDDVAWTRGHRRHPIPPEVEHAIRAELREQAMRLVADGRDVVVDGSFWSRSSRDEYRRMLAPLDVIPEVHYLATPRDVVLARVARRDNSAPDSLALPPELAAAYVDGFEVPSPEEGPLRMLRS
ncbi:AAA family ATPase [Microbacterium sp. NPDC056234]|uniref:AAA family ATPase n=1 Tax=Microbacterium sp. NPDC056234 TaxID=3345757 RepID=UPI0035E1D0C3